MRFIALSPRAAFRSPCICGLVVWAALVPGPGTEGAAARTAATQPAALKIVVINGEDAVNIIQQKTAVAPVVEVRDRNDLPIAGVPVTFAIGGGGGATFAGGAQTLTVVTNAAGRAIAAGLTPTANGALQISASAVLQGQTAVATIAQTNVLTAAQAASAGGAGGAGGGGLSNTALAGIGGAAGAGAIAAVVATRGEAATAPALATTVSPNGAGIRAVTEFAFTASGGRLSAPAYAWEFGDGATATGSAVTHVYASEGTFQVTLRATASGEEERSTASVRVGSVTGTWVMVNSPTSGVNAGVVFTHRLDIAQSGTALTGSWTTEAVPVTPIGGGTSTVSLRGTLTPPRVITVEQLGECLRMLSAGTVDDNLATISGNGPVGNPSCAAIQGSQTQSFRFVRQ